jgi:hypothetical protein
VKSLILALVIMLVPVKATVPTLKRLAAERYQAINPLLVPVTMTIECFGDYEPVKVIVPAGVSQELEIRQPGGYAAMCVLASWVRVP